MFAYDHESVKIVSRLWFDLYHNEVSSLIILQWYFKNVTAR